MASMVDYIDWRGDLSFEQDPFNEIDNIILSELCYTDFDGIVPGPYVDETISIKEVHEKFFAKYDRKEIMKRKTSLKVAPFLMDHLIKSERFSDMRLTGYVNEVVEEEDVQFSVVTFILGDGTYFVAYRGTDSTIVGWKEDINMGYLYQTPGQKKAMQYLDINFKDRDCKMRVGGHSKGGNFAVYASSFCDKSIQDKIINVYTNDGPGFQDKVIESEGYNRILPKIYSIVPGSSIVGMLLENKFEHNVVRSENEGASQHDAMSWQVNRNRFIRCVGVADSSIKLDAALTIWLNGLNDEERKKFIDTLFKPLEEANITTIDELSTLSISNYKAIKEAVDNLSDEEHEIVKGYLREFMRILLAGYKPKKSEGLADKKQKIEEIIENKKKKRIEKKFIKKS